MKSQYIGDVGDYGKYGLLRFLSLSGVSVGVNWYLTPDDGKSDGSHIEYLSDVRMRAYDPDLYDAMSGIAFFEGKCIEMLQQDKALDDMCFYDAPMNFLPLDWRYRTEAREKWHWGALQALEETEIVFLDPDNGLSVKKRSTQRDAQKFILPTEIVDYYSRGQQVMYYHRRPRKVPEAWLADKRLMKTSLPNAKLLALSFHRWVSRSYIFVLHEEQYARYSQLLETFLSTAWGTYRVDGKVAFTAEEI